MKLQHTSLLALTLTVLTACGGGSSPAPTPTPGPTPNPNPGNGTTLTRSALTACPVVTNSQDLAASGCLKGTIVGKTLSGAACSYTIGTGGQVSYSSPSSSFNYTPGPKTFSLFTYAKDVILIWKLVSVDSQFDVTLQYTFSDGSLQINATDASNVSTTCTTTL